MASQDPGGSPVGAGGRPGRAHPDGGPPADAAATVVGRFVDLAARRPDDVALRWREGGGWAELTWSDYAGRACAVAGGLRALGVERGERVALMVRNRPEFHVTDLAALLLGAVPVSLYTSSPPERVRYLARHSGAVVAVIEDPEHLERFLKVRGDLPALRHLVVVDDPEGLAPPDAVPFGRLESVRPVDLHASAAGIRPQDLATVIYTSGTTGRPKGTLITHGNVAAAVDGLLAALGHGVAGRRMISFLPMAHIAERVACHYVHLAEGTQVTTCPDQALVTDYLREVRPQLFFAVPRVWEKAHAAIEAVADQNPAQRPAFDAALAVGAEVAALRGAGRPVPDDLAARHAEADAMLGLVRSLMGLDDCEAAVSTAAPISREVLGFFRAVGIPISEVYGLSEATGPLTWDPHRVKIGDAGRPLPNAEVRIAADGEILARGPMVFPGYLDDPGATAAALDHEGWLHTGDLGVLEDGRLRIVGRSKDLLVTAGGENIAPNAIESRLRGHPLVSEAFVVGDRRPYLVGLITLDTEAATAYLRSRGERVDGTGQLAASEAVRAEIDHWVAEVNAQVPPIERVKRFRIMDREWAADSDELTPTMKVRRQAVLEKFSADIDALYD